MHGRKLVYEVLQQQGPLLSDMVDLVQEHMRKTVAVEVFDGTQRIVVGEPQVVKTHVDGLVAPFAKRLFDMLEHQCGLAGSTCAHDADKRLGPVDFLCQIPMETAIRLADQAIARPKQRFYLFGGHWAPQSFIF